VPFQLSGKSGEEPNDLSMALALAGLGDLRLNLALIYRGRDVRSLGETEIDSTHLGKF